jgi:hypothetical protein
MFGLLSKYVDQLIDSIVAPVWERVKALSLAGRACVLALLLAAAWLGGHFDKVSALLSQAPRVARVARSDSATPPLSRRDRAKLRDAISRLAASLEPEVSYAGTQYREAWPIAQVTVALQGLSGVDSARAGDFLESQTDSVCGCWRQIPSAASPQNVAITGWVIFALTSVGYHLNTKQLLFLLSNQHAGGWWPMFPTSEREEYGSTYATAWSLLALNEQLRKSFVPSDDTARVRLAIKHGYGWLISQHASKSARWKDYPNSTAGKVSESISGLVLHVLHHVAGSDLQSMDQVWLTGLPAEIPGPATEEVSGLWINTREGLFQDVSSQYRLPWLLVGTADAYPAGTWTQKASALGWIERALKETSILHAETIRETWIRAEILIALKHLAGKY